MQITSKYNFINNVTGWVVFAIALITYWLTLEPTVSYWDCGEFITQADKLEIGHPPGNPIFMLTARFFSNFAFGDPTKVALMVNAMSGLLSALTILLLFWTVTHLTARLLLRRNTTKGMTIPQYLVIMGSGVVGALAYTWSDTFWFSAVEGEVYAFSSFCTALVFWLILKWENRADKPHSDRYLILIAYVIGVSIAVHLLNLLCIPAIVLVFTYRKWKNVNAGKSLLALLVGFAIIVFVLYGLVPGFINVAGWMEMTFVNGMGLPFNAGTIIYTILTLAVFIWCLFELYTQRSANRIRLSFCLGVLLSGMLFLGSSVWLGLILFCGLIYLIYYVFRAKLPVRWLNVIMWSIFVIFIGYSSYAVILIRSYANPPLNQSQPDNVFDLAGYLNREQYGETPLLYGPTYQSPNHYLIDGYGDFSLGNGAYVTTPAYKPDVEKGKKKIAKGVAGVQPHSALNYLSEKENASNAAHTKKGGDYYVVADYDMNIKSAPSMNMLLPRIHSRAGDHKELYELWVPTLGSNEHDLTEITAYDIQAEEEVPMLDRQIDNDHLAYNDLTESYNFTQTLKGVKPTFSENLEFFFNYQVNHMYWRYFLWNFVGRQNDYNNQYGEKDYGNWISGISFIDNARLGDQSTLPEPLGTGNKAHNTFYFLPLLLGLGGLIWQAFRGRKGIEQFWIVFFLFFMTGLAIVLYLNQPPLQPRERDYAFAGSFYAFAIWIGLGVAALYCLFQWLADPDRRAAKLKGDKKDKFLQEQKANEGRNNRIYAIIACVIGLVIPLQMVSQTWDDHDRSGRYTARDFAKNYLESLEPNAIIFCNGDNDTFPLWYAQEVEGVRPDVKIINLSYLQSDWYINQQRLQSYLAPGVKMTATPADIAYGRRDMAMLGDSTDTETAKPLVDALKSIYANNSYNEYGIAEIPYSNTYIPIDKSAVAKKGLVDATGVNPVEENLTIDLSTISGGQLSLSQLIMLDIIATNAANGWERPIYWANTVGASNYSMFQPYLRAVGMTYQLVPYKGNQLHDTERSYNIIKNKYLYGGLDATKLPYIDETAGRMVTVTRMTMEGLATDLVTEAELFTELAKDEGSYQGADGKNNEAGRRSWEAQAKENYRRAIEILYLMLDKLPAKAYPFSFIDYYQTGMALCKAGKALGDKKAETRGLQILQDGMKTYARNVKYVEMLMNKFDAPIAKDTDGSIVKLPYPNAQISNENSRIMTLYYELVQEYDKYAGAGKAEEFLLKNAGLSKVEIDNLKRYYEMAQSNAQSNAGYADMSSSEQILATLQSYMPDVIRVQSLSPDEYVNLDIQTLTADSVFYYFVEMYEVAGGDRQELIEALKSNGIDVERSNRIYQEFRANNPDAFKELEGEAASN